MGDWSEPGLELLLEILLPCWNTWWLRALYVVAACAIMIDRLILKPGSTWPGLLIALSSVPIFYLSARGRS